MRWYRIDLQADLGTPRLSWRRLGVLVRQLPREAGLPQAVHGDSVAWGTVEHLLATLCDLTIQGNWNFVQSKSRKELPPAKLLRRPGQKDPVEPGVQRMSVAEFAKAFGGQTI